MKKYQSILVILLFATLPFSLMAAKKNENVESKNHSVVTSKSNQKELAEKKAPSAIIKQDHQVQDLKANSTTNNQTPSEIISNTNIAPVVNSPASGEQINWQVISSGGTDASSESYQLLGTLGQSAIGISSSSSFQLFHGFWQPLSGDGSCCGLYTGGYPGNTNCDTGGLRDLADITKLIDNVYISKEELCCQENGNANADGAGLINLADITKLIDHVYISKDELPGCV